MFEREVKFIYDFNSNKVKKLGSSATFTELLPLGIHPAILQYISAEIEYRVFEDRQTLLKHSMFDYSGAEISKHFGKIADEIKKEKSFSTDFLSKVILHATSFNVNYLIRPNWSLKKLIFDTSDSNSVLEINQILNYAYFYKHLTKVIRNFLEKKNLITLNKEEFAGLLINFDKVSMQSYGKDIIETAIKSMATFFNIGSMNQNTIPLQGIGVFLQEKKMTNHLELLQRKLGDQTKSKIEISDIKALLFSLPVDNVEFIETPKKLEDFNIIETKEPAKEEPVEIVEPEAEPELEDESQDQIEEESLEAVDEEDEKEDDVEIKLRANKEKEVAKTEEVEKEIYEEEEEFLEAEYEDPAEYIVDQHDSGVEVILTVEDLEETEIVQEQENDSIEEIELEDNEEPSEIEEFVDLDENENEKEEDDEHVVFVTDENESDFEELGLEDDEQEDELVVEEEVEYQMPPQADDEYSYPERPDTKNEEKDDNTDDLEFEEDKLEDEIEEVPDSEDEDEFKSQTTLFGEVPKTDNAIDGEDEFINEFGTQNFSKRIDISDLLENRNMTKIIEVVFDYDMEEFANAIEKICDSTSRQEAFATLQEIFEINQVNPTSKEAQSFRDIISEYFDQS